MVLKLLEDFYYNLKFYMVYNFLGVSKDLVFGFISSELKGGFIYEVVVRKETSS